MAVDASRFGLFTPVLFMPPGAEAWEAEASFADVVAIAQAAERLGYHHLTCGEHVAIPADVAPVRGSRYYDPLATFGYLAAVTERIALATHVLVLGYSHPLEIAKRYGTLDRVSGGRLILGVGVGTLKPEFDLLGLGGEAFDARGARADEALRALRAALGRLTPEHHGRYYDFAGQIVDPCASRTDVPIWVGGRSARSLRRAVELGDAWVPFGALTPLLEILAQGRQTEAWEARATPLELVLPHDGALDPIGQPEAAAAALRPAFAAGATRVVVKLSARSCGHYVQQLEALAALDA